MKLAYLDPPFNTQQAFAHYDDALEHSVWLTMMRDRLLQIRKLLAPNGSVWVHCDDSEQAYLKVMMDEVFGRDNFVGTSRLEADNSSSHGRRSASRPVHDYAPRTHGRDDDQARRGIRHDRGACGEVPIIEIPIRGRAGHVHDRPISLALGFAEATTGSYAWRGSKRHREGLATGLMASEACARLDERRC